MAEVSMKYKDKLPEDISQALRQVKPRLPATFADVIGNFGESNLVEEFLSQDMPMLEFFEFMDEMQAPEMQDVVNALPDGLQMRHWAEMYHLVNADLRRVYEAATCASSFQVR